MISVGRQGLGAWTGAQQRPSLARAAGGGNARWGRPPLPGEGWCKAWVACGGGAEFSGGAAVQLATCSLPLQEDATVLCVRLVQAPSGGCWAGRQPSPQPPHTAWHGASSAAGWPCAQCTAGRWTARSRRSWSCAAGVGCLCWMLAALCSCWADEVACLPAFYCARNSPAHFAPPRAGSSLSPRRWPCCGTCSGAGCSTRWRGRQSGWGCWRACPPWRPTCGVCQQSTAGCCHSLPSRQLWCCSARWVRTAAAGALACSNTGCKEGAGGQREPRLPTSAASDAQCAPWAVAQARLQPVLTTAIPHPSPRPVRWTLGACAGWRRRALRA